MKKIHIRFIEQSSGLRSQIRRWGIWCDCGYWQHMVYGSCFIYDLAPTKEELIELYLERIHRRRSGTIIVEHPGKKIW